jgi:membrane peptidoglycan carboxypeptidase
MTARESAWDGGPPDPPTAPLPAVDYWGNVSSNYFAPFDWQPPATYQPPQAFQIPRARRRGRRLLRRLTLLIVVIVALAVLAFGVLLLVTPSVRNATALAQAQALAHHSVYPGPPVPARFAASLLATEDHRFYSEPGIDPFAVGRVIEAAITRKGDQGGATIDQQLAKMLYTPGGSGALAKAKQVGLAVKLSLSYSHPQILRMYADVAYFGHGYYGLSAASCGYFGVTSAGLSWPEAAMLAGLVQGPSSDDPLLHYAQARAREHHVLGRLVAMHTLSQAQADAAFAQPLHLVGGRGTGCTA